MDKLEAIAHVKKLAIDVPAFQVYEARAITLINNPAQLKQGRFGICGMTNMVRSLLMLDDLTRFAALLDAIFRDQPFNGIKAPDGKLLEGRLRQWDQKVDHRTVVKPDAVPDKQFQLDFILARSLGKLLKVRSPLIYQNQLSISTWIDANFRTKPDSDEIHLLDLDGAHAATLDNCVVSEKLAYDLRMNDWRAWLVCGFHIQPEHATITRVQAGHKWNLTLAATSIPDRRQRVLHVEVTGSGSLEVSYDSYGEFGAYQKDGDLGLDPVGMLFLMTDVLGARTCSFWPVTIFVDDTVNRINTELANPGAFVYGFIDSTKNWTSAAANAHAFQTPPTRREAYHGMPPTIGTHIVMITGQLTVVGDDVLIPVWTWGNSYTARIPKQYLSGYLVGYSLGHF
jgi:hypothetical protein